MKKLYCCESSRRMYEDYYADQSGGGGVPYYSGTAGQRGHGLGSILSGLFRSAMPMIKRGLAFFGKHALKTGLEVANDVVEGSSFVNSARRRVPEGINRFTTAAGFTNQAGSGRRRRARSASVIPHKKNKRSKSRRSKSKRSKSKGSKSKPSKTSKKRKSRSKKK